jgi:glutamate/aspartate transport system substrate-binding protein
MQLVQSGEVDIECGSTANTPDRHQFVAFSNTIFLTNSRILTKTDSGVNDFQDLHTKNVVTITNSAAERALRNVNSNRGLGMNIITVRSIEDAVNTLLSGRATAYVNDDIFLFSALSKFGNRSDWKVVGSPLTQEAFGCTFRLNDADFKTTVDGAIERLGKTGELENLYLKWFMNPIPPRGVNVQFPLSDELKKMFENPNDRAL